MHLIASIDLLILTEELAIEVHIAIALLVEKEIEGETM